MNGSSDSDIDCDTEHGGLDSDIDSDIDSDMFTIIIILQQKHHKTVEISTKKAYSLLKQFKQVSIFNKYAGKSSQEINRWTFTLNSQDEVDELLRFIDTGVRSMYRTDSIDLSFSGVNIVERMTSIKPDDKFSEYLLETNLKEYKHHRDIELEIRREFRKLFIKDGCYESTDKLHGKIDVEYVRPFKDISTYSLSELKEELYENVLLGKRPDEKRTLLCDKDANAHFLSKIPEHHRRLFTTDNLANEFCAAGGSVTHSLFEPEEVYSGDIDIFPLVPSNVEGFIHRFITEVQKTGYVELSRNKHAININWYPTPLILIKKIFFPWLDAVYSRFNTKHPHFNLNDGTLSSLLGSSDVVSKEGTRIKPRYRNKLKNIHDRHHISILKDVSITEGTDMMKKAIADNVNILSRLDLPHHIIEQLSLYITNSYDDIMKVLTFDDDYGAEFFTSYLTRLQSTNINSKYILRVMKKYTERIKKLYKCVATTYCPRSRMKSITNLNRTWRMELCKMFDIGKIQYQIILQRNTCVAEVLSRFDVDSCCTAYYRGQIYTIYRSSFALMSRLNVIDPTRQSPSYHHRLLKYLDRGFGICIPSLDRNKIIDKPMENTIGLSNLVAAYSKKINDAGFMISASKKTWYNKSEMIRIVFYHAEDVCKSTIAGWLITGHRAIGEYGSNLIMNDVSEMIGSIDSKVTPFYFSAYISNLDMLYYRSRVNIIDEAVFKNCSKDVIDKLLRDNSYGMARRLVHKDNTERILDSAKVFTHDNHGRVEKYLTARDNRYNIHYIDNQYQSNLMDEMLKPYRYIQGIIKNITNALVLGRSYKCLKGRFRYTTKMLDVHPIVSNVDDMDSYITMLVQNLEMDDDIVVLSFTRTTSYIDIRVREDHGILSRRDITHLTNKFPKETKDIELFAHQTMGKLFLTKLLSLECIIIPKLKTIDIIHRLMIVRTFEKIRNVLKDLISKGNIRYVINNPAKYAYVITVRVHYTLSKSLAYAFDNVEHSYQCIGWYNGGVVYNERCMDYLKNGDCVLDPSFRQGKSFEMRTLYDYRTKYILPYRKRKIKLWRDLRTSGNLHEFLIQKLFVEPYENDVDDNWYDSAGIESHVDYEQRITFLDRRYLITKKVETVVLTSSGKSMKYTIDFGKKNVTVAKDIRDYYKCVKEYGRMAFISDIDALTLMGKGVLSGTDKVVVSF